jgi:hypothetical protein
MESWRYRHCCPQFGAFEPLIVAESLSNHQLLQGDARDAHRSY